MKQNNKVYSLLGLAYRARKLITGEELVVKGIQSGQIMSVVLSNDASENTRKKIIDKCTTYKVPYYIYFDRYTLGHAIGKHARVVIGVTDRGFSYQLDSLME